MVKNTILMMLVATIALAGGIYTHSLSNATQSLSEKVILDFSLPDLSGRQRHLSEWKDKIVILNFWASWCHPCLQEIPEFIKLQTKYKDKNLQFIGIAVEDGLAVNEYVNSIKINYPILIGGDQAIVLSHSLGNSVNAIPFTLIVNKQGIVVHRQLGELSKEKIEKVIRPLMKQL